MNANLTSRMEIAFWDTVIFFLSRFPGLRRIAQWLYRNMPLKSLVNGLKLAVTAAAMGLVSGFVVYFGFTILF